MEFLFRTLPFRIQHMLTPEIKVVGDPKLVAATAAERIVAAAESAIEIRGSFSIVLSGGNTPKSLYALLATEPFRSVIDWTKVHVFFGDERCVPRDHLESNYRMARETLLSKVPVPGDNVCRIRAEADPAEAALEYDQTLGEYFADSGPDVTLLGMGDDGHTASLFPRTDALKEAKHRCVANFVPQMNKWRITMSPAFLNRSQEVLILVTGVHKAARVAQALEGPRVPEELPIQLIQPASGRLAWIIDAAAAGM
jgi:6-phosphogluconolactonase